MSRNRTIYLLLFVIFAFVLASCGGEEGASEPGYSSDIVADGKDLYAQNCSVCHGPEGKGLPALGKDLTSSQFVRDLSDDELLAFINEGRASDHPDNSTGVAMPPKAGNPSLTDEKIQSIIAFVRSIQE